jgi:transcriptional regulator with XRE-family HTH domain
MIGQEVRRRREELGLTGAQLAERSELSPGAISQIENGKRIPSSTTVMKLAEGLGIEVGELYPKKAQPPLPYLGQEESGPSIVEGEAHLSGTGKLEATWKIMQVLEELADGKISLEVAKERAREAVAA